MLDKTRIAVDGRDIRLAAEAFSEEGRRDAVMAQLERAYGANAELWWGRWRLFFLSCAELFGYDEGQQWWVAHYLFGARP